MDIFRVSRGGGFESAGCIGGVWGCMGCMWVGYDVCRDELVMVLITGRCGSISSRIDGKLRRLMFVDLDLFWIFWIYFEFIFNFLNLF